MLRKRLFSYMQQIKLFFIMLYSQWSIAQMETVSTICCFSHMREKHKGSPELHQGALNLVFFSLESPKWEGRSKQQKCHYQLIYMIELIIYLHINAHVIKPI